jgi:hypothetical protein
LIKKAKVEKKQMFTEQGVPVSYFVAEEVTNELGQKVKIFKPHPVYREMQTMKEMIDSFDQTK